MLTDDERENEAWNEWCRTHPNKPQIPSFEDWKAGFEAGRREGATSMQNRAAIVADHDKTKHHPYTMGWAAGERIAAAIRALPTETGTPE